VPPPLLRTARLITAYRRYLGSADSPRYADDVSRFYAPSTLVRLLSRGGVEARRAAALALGMLGDRTVIEPLGRRLADSDRGVRLAADDSFRGLLVRDAAPTHHHQLLQVMHLNDGGEHAAALAPALILVDQAPWYAEAHHQLAICWQGLEEMEAAAGSFGDCLWRCRFHYPAWQGLARCHVAQGDLSGALRALRLAVAICPDLECVRLQIRSLEGALGEGGGLG
jgi:hypothetical protein